MEIQTGEDKKKIFTDQYQFNTRGNSGQSRLKLRAKCEFMRQVVLKA